MTDQKKFISMDTMVTIKVVSQQKRQRINDAIDEAAAVFYKIERICSRFNPQSELMRLSSHPRMKIPVSPILFQALKLAVETARETDGALDPTIGRKMEKRGFDKNYLSGEKISSPFADAEKVTYKDILLNEQKRTVWLKKPMVIDLNAVVKGMAVDMAAKVLSDSGFDQFIVEAGGDIYVSGKNEHHEPWKIGIRNPIDRDQLLGSVRLSNMGICTSGNYERLSTLIPGEYHLIDPGKGKSPKDIVSCTIIAPFAMLADAFSTAAYVMGSVRGIKKMEELNLDCLMITRSLEKVFTNKLKEKWSWIE
ncbi:FAD:protein FMN transferase [Sporolactobacillus sp. THM7-4]|nr:FAD:protein FMN transferase [Sporolactobacillus sp. THM7-4]